MRWSEARTIFELIGELRELGDEPAAWRTHLAESLRRLVGARVAVSAEARLGPRLFGAELLGLSHVGWHTERERDVFCTLGGDPTEAPQERLTARSFTLPRRALVTDESWYRSPFAQELSRVAGLDQALFSQQRLAPRGVWSLLAIYRDAGDGRPFSPSQLRLVDRVHRELARLWSAPDPRDALPRRLRQTLGELDGGRSEKEIADALGLSQHTVHQYVKSLYRRYAVRSRAELTARTRQIARRRPLLSIELL